MTQASPQPNKHTLTPYLFISGADKAIEYYKKVFGAIVVCQHYMGDKVCHAELNIGDSLIMLADELPEMHAKSPKLIGGTPVSLALAVDDVDQVFAMAIKEGATELQAVKDQFYGERAGSLLDPFGHMWHISTHIEDVSEEEMQKRVEQFVKDGACSK